MHLPIDRPFVEKLARFLGCGCAEEVFERIRKPEILSPLFWSVVVGEKLMLCLMDAAQAVKAPELLERLRAVRDEQGLNRVRLVMVGQVEPSLFETSQSACLDDRMHVHAIDSSELNSLQ